MGLSNYNKKPRHYPAEAVCDKLYDVYAEWFQHTPHTEIARDHHIWKIILDDIRFQARGDVLGTLGALNTIRFSDELTFHKNRHFQCAAMLLCRPIHEDILLFDGLKSIVEDFYLKTYGVAPHISETCFNPYRAEIAVATGSRLHRLITGYPSPKRIIRDWKRATSDIYCFEFSNRIRKTDLVFRVELPEYNEDSDDIDHDFINSTLSILKSIRSA